jgi:hypothetical protein
MLKTGRMGRDKLGVGISPDPVIPLPRREGQQGQGLEKGLGMRGRDSHHGDAPDVFVSI